MWGWFFRKTPRVTIDMRKANGRTEVFITAQGVELHFGNEGAEVVMPRCQVDIYVTDVGPDKPRMNVYGWDEPIPF
jgi:hypothetical protein